MGYDKLRDFDQKMVKNFHEQLSLKVTQVIMMTKDGKFDEGLFFLMKIWHWADDHDLFLRKKLTLRI